MSLHRCCAAGVRLEGEGKTLNRNQLLQAEILILSLVARTQESGGPSHPAWPAQMFHFPSNEPASTGGPALIEEQPGTGGSAVGVPAWGQGGLLSYNRQSRKTNSWCPTCETPARLFPFGGIYNLSMMHYVHRYLTILAQAFRDLLLRRGVLQHVVTSTSCVFPYMPVSPNADYPNVK